MRKYIGILILFTVCAISMMGCLRKVNDVDNTNNAGKAEKATTLEQKTASTSGSQGEASVYVHSEYKTLEELLDSATDVVIGEFVQSYHYGMYSLYEFAVQERYLGEDTGTNIYGYVLHGMYTASGDESQSYNTAKESYEKGEKYFLILERSVRVYGEHDHYLIPSAIYIPVDDVSAWTVYGEPLVEHSACLSAAEEVNLDTLIACVEENVGDNNKLFYGEDYIRSSDMAEIIAGSYYIVKVSVDIYIMDGISYPTSRYNCTVLNSYKGDIEVGAEIEVHFFQGTVEEGETYIVALETAPSTIDTYSFSSKDSLWNVEEENEIVQIISGE